jgi:hypothetical protein
MNDVPCHELKIIDPHYSHILCGTKQFEIRNNDRNFMLGDLLCLRHWDQLEKYFVQESPPIFAEIIYLTEYGQKLGMVVLGIKLLNKNRKWSGKEKRRIAHMIDNNRMSFGDVAEEFKVTESAIRGAYWRHHNV